MPINQIVEVEKADDESINIIKLVISDLAVSAKSDAAGALRLWTQEPKYAHTPKHTKAKK